MKKTADFCIAYWQVGEERVGGSTLHHRRLFSRPENGLGARLNGFARRAYLIRDNIALSTINKLFHL
jgi:hypothetical protein